MQGSGTGAGSLSLRRAETRPAAPLAVLSVAAVLILASCQGATPVGEVDTAGLVSRGQGLFSDYCASCHGGGGRGDGVVAASLKHPPADLTRITARAGGVFPLDRVMSVIDGYTRRNDHGTVMPEMGAVIASSAPVMVDTGDGLMTPVPENLLALAAYLKSIQRP